MSQNTIIDMIDKAFQLYEAYCYCQNQTLNGLLRALFIVEKEILAVDLKKCIVNSILNDLKVIKIAL